MEFRQYQNEDYEAVCDFLIALNEKDRMHINWNWARFEWMAEHPEFDKNAINSIGLWLDQGHVVGAAIYDMYFGEAFCGVLPEYFGLFPQLLDYAWQMLRDENGLGIAICTENQREIQAAEEAGFYPAEQWETVMCVDLEGCLDASLPEGYHLTQLDPGDDLEAFQWLLWQGFDHGEDRSEFEKHEPYEGRRRMHFDPSLSLSAVNVAGEAQAYCCMWYMKKTDYAYVEPVCTVPAARGKGLASALVMEALHRVKAYGAKYAYVISDMEFYRKLGFEKELKYRFFWKK